MAYVDGRPAQVVKIAGKKLTLQIFPGTQGMLQMPKWCFWASPHNQSFQ
jgi:hypothetical protein